MKKIIDTFPYFNEKELLELRINVLKNHVDKFVISELNYTHSGIPKSFTCKQTIRELGLPEEMIEVVEISVDEHLTPTEMDIIHSSQAQSLKDVHMWVRERIQRDGVALGLKDVEGDVVIINGDCDEIINPDVLEYFSNLVRNNNNILKVPLVSLEGRADKRLFHDNGEPVKWENSLFMCKREHLNNKTISNFRGNIDNPYPVVWATQDGNVIQDCGWHFTWMGDSERKNIKMRSFIHSANVTVINNLSTSSFDSIKNDSGVQGEIDAKLITQNYPIELLPREIFSLPRVKDFLLPGDIFPSFVINKTQHKRVWVVDDFYENPYAIRNYALTRPYVDGGIGRGFIGRRTLHQYLFPGLKERFEEIMGEKIVAWESHGMNGRFQTSLAGEPLVYHCDAQRWAGMLFLTPDAPFECGTTLYAHKATRIRHSSHPGIMSTFKPGNLDKTPYEPVDVMGNVFNRLVIFDAGCLHSASEYFGYNNYTCRLWQMFFFD